jgi:hypothetical protein
MISNELAPPNRSNRAAQLVAWAAYTGFAEAARELIEGESHDYYARALGNSELFRKAWAPGG